MKKEYCVQSKYGGDWITYYDDDEGLIFDNLDEARKLLKHCQGTFIDFTYRIAYREVPEWREYRPKCMKDKPCMNVNGLRECCGEEPCKFKEW